MGDINNMNYTQTKDFVVFSNGLYKNKVKNERKFILV